VIKYKTKKNIFLGAQNEYIIYKPILNL